MVINIYIRLASSSILSIFVFVSRWRQLDVIFTPSHFSLYLYLCEWLGLSVLLVSSWASASESVCNRGGKTGVEASI